MEGESAENDRRGPVYPGIALDYFSQVVCPGGSEVLVHSFDHFFELLPTDRLLDCGERIGAVCPSAQHGLRHAEERSGRAIEYLSPVDQIVLVLPVCFAEHTAHHLVEHGERSIGQLGFHLSDEDQQSSKPPLIIEAVEVLGTED
jgi:hypothetical protein